MKQFFVLAAIAISLLTIGCVDDDFGLPPVDGEDPDITANTTIAELKAMHTLGTVSEITEDIIITGVIISDDRQGNFFRQLVIQDSTGGIEIRMNETDLYNEYGRGRRIYVRCQNLWLGDFAGVTQIGAAPVEEDGDVELTRIPAALFDSYVIKGQWNQDVTPSVKLASELTAADISTLITIEDAAFQIAPGEDTYAVDSVDAATGTRIQESANRNISICGEFGQTLIVRSSGFAAFASTPLPEGSGPITGVYGVFNSDRQLLIRDTDDVQFSGEPCGMGDGSDIASLRTAYAGEGSVIPFDNTIRATVISDRNGGNIQDQNMVVQDETAGIVIRFTDAHSFNLGTVVDIDVQGLTMSEFNDVLQITDVPFSAVTDAGTSSTLTPRVATTAQIIASGEAWESTLVTIQDATISGSSTYAGSTSINDADGSIDMFTRNSASFANDAIPTGSVSITAIVSEFRGDRQVNMRNGSDVTGGMMGPDPDVVSIRQVRDRYTGSAADITDNIAVSGVVISDRSSNNLNDRNVVIQDATAGILVRFSDTHVLNLGEQVTITARGAELSEFNGLLQLNNVALSSITSNTPGTLPEPRVATIAEVTSNAETWESTLVRIEDATFPNAGTYRGDVSVMDATGTMNLFTNFSANFSSTPLPTGQVDITAIVDDNNMPQLRLRNVSDVSGGMVTDPVQASVADVRGLFSGDDQNITQNWFIRGVVISDGSAMNITDRNLVLQDGDAGIVVRFTEAHSYAIGTELEINIQGVELSEFNTLLQLNNVPPTNVTSTSAGTLPAPRVATADEVLTNGEDWESTLVTINNVTITGDNGTYAQGTTVTDATNSIAMFTRSQADFADTALPSNMVNLTGIVSEFGGTRQINMRNINDVQ